MMEKRRLERIEQYIFTLFRERGTTRLLAKEIFESTDEFANADLVRAAVWATVPVAEPSMTVNVSPSASLALSRTLPVIAMPSSCAV